MAPDDGGDGDGNGNGESGEVPDDGLSYDFGHSVDDIITGSITPPPTASGGGDEPEVQGVTDLRNERSCA